MEGAHLTEGTIEFRIGHETHKTWYKAFGDLKSSRRPNAIPVIFYDQIGCGGSSHLRYKPVEFWTPTLFMDELDNMLNHFGIWDNFDLYGHSWGGILGAQFVATRQPKGLRRLVIANSPASLPLWEKSCNELLDGMPEGVQQILRKHEEAGTMDDKEYKDAMGLYMAKHVIRVPLSDGMLKTLAAMAEDPTVTHATLGKKQFKIEGSLKTYSVISGLHKIAVPTLLLNGRYDEASDACVMPFFERIPKVRWYRFAESSHMPHWEERDLFMKIVGEFLRVHD
ncbi:proline iminopeptidase protein [Rickenella mellea]|uniref:Proline iminopeptidase protein n=1 Tax=Rickenella mellea TaxID=50990 RepID=A0A4Y7Q2G5_9AGAM|nr:proline iminopeptidase protein [Rickenella mellea]